MSTIRIEDEDGFATEWPWPDDASIIANTGFVGVFEALHDARRADEDGHQTPKEKA